MIPNAEELDGWLASIEKGQAVTEMFPRFVEGYRALLKVAEKAQAVTPGTEEWLLAPTTAEYVRHRELREALAATGLRFEAPAQGVLFEGAAG